MKTPVSFPHVLLINSSQLFMCEIVVFIFKLNVVSVKFHVMFSPWLQLLELFFVFWIPFRLHVTQRLIGPHVSSSELGTKTLIRCRPKS